MSSVCAVGSVGQIGARSVSFANAAMCAPPRRPKTTMSSSELVPRRLAPWTLTHAHSPAAYSPGTGVSSAPVTTRASTSVGMPPIA